MAPVPQHLKRFWARVIGGRTGHVDGGADCGADVTLRCGLSVGVKETLQYLTECAPACWAVRVSA